MCSCTVCTVAPRYSEVKPFQGSSSHLLTYYMFTCAHPQSSRVWFPSCNVWLTLILCTSNVKDLITTVESLINYLDFCFVHCPLQITMINRRFSFFLSGLELTHQGTSVKGNSLIVKGVVALGSVPSHAGKVSLTLASRTLLVVL